MPQPVNQAQHTPVRGAQVWFANPYPLFKGVMAAHSLIAQVDGPFLNAGIFYVQHVARGDATAWALEELNRRIGRLTYHPESVAQLPHSSWARAPYFANADEQAGPQQMLSPPITTYCLPLTPHDLLLLQAIFNDVIASSLTAKPTHAGVELSEPRFKAHMHRMHMICTACTCTCTGTCTGTGTGTGTGTCTCTPV